MMRLLSLVFLLLSFQKQSEAFVVSHSVQRRAPPSTSSSTKLDSWSGSSGYLDNLNGHDANNGPTAVAEDPASAHSSYQQQPQATQPQQQQQQQQQDQWAYLANYNAAPAATTANNGHDHGQAAAAVNHGHGQAAATYGSSSLPQTPPATPATPTTPTTPEDYPLQRNYPFLNGQAFQDENPPATTTTTTTTHDINDNSALYGRTQPVTTNMQVEDDLDSVEQQQLRHLYDQQQQDLQRQQAERDEQETFLRMMSSEIQVKKFLGQNTYPITDVPVDVMISRAIDTIEDAFVHARRVPYKWGWTDLPDFDIKARPTIVVLGTGWAAHAFSKVACTFDLKLIVVSPVNHFVSTFLILEVSILFVLLSWGGTVDIYIHIHIVSLESLTHSFIP